MRRTGDHAVAAGWGFAEATFFFIVPDVWTSWVGLRRPRRAVGTCLSALGGALAGGAVTYAWGRRSSAAASRRMMAQVPAISGKMVDDVDQDVTERGHAALMTGPLRGVPYKIYARSSGLQRRSLLSFLVWSVPARLIRFLAVTLLAAGVAAAARRVFPRIDERLISGIFVALWAGFYGWFFSAMRRR